MCQPAPRAEAIHGGRGDAQVLSDLLDHNLHTPNEQQGLYHRTLAVEFAPRKPAIGLPRMRALRFPTNVGRYAGANGIDQSTQCSPASPLALAHPISITHAHPGCDGA